MRKVLVLAAAAAFVAGSASACPYSIEGKQSVKAPTQNQSTVATIAVPKGK